MTLKKDWLSVTWKLQNRETVNSEVWEKFNEDLTIQQQCELGGEEYMAGYILGKLKGHFPELILDPSEEVRFPLSWFLGPSKGGLILP